jgi:hypothetical protein
MGLMEQIGPIIAIKESLCLYFGKKSRTFTRKLSKNNHYASKIHYYSGSNAVPTATLGTAVTDGDTCRHQANSFTLRQQPSTTASQPLHQTCTCRRHSARLGR